MVGLDSSGKTFIANRLIYGNEKYVRPVLPTKGYTVYQMVYKGQSYTLWDCGGSKRFRDLWRNHYAGTYGLIFVVDASDRCRMDEARDVLHTIAMDREMEDVVVVVLANKQDVPNAMKAKEIEFALDMNRLNQQHWHIQEVCAMNGYKLDDCLLPFRLKLKAKPTLSRSIYAKIDNY
ncbi:unnamed protein product [Oppiella nova]|uniref:ADP-ribosylation factor-like protein 6 n=1 Tax=Oppiella nova TaxID=334625 RepID=A0A7R9M8U9_9ACAR|nr:unnamed protein product [Oppiella nova]CAG2172763.1 unnamed protein product [Oppiella nova]